MEYDKDSRDRAEADQHGAEKQIQNVAIDFGHGWLSNRGERATVEETILGISENWAVRGKAMIEVVLGWGEYRGLRLAQKLSKYQG